MENKTDIIEMLTETKGKLDTIKELNKEIHTALDVIEKRRNNQQTAAGGSGQVVGDDNESKTSNSELTKDTATLSHKDDDNPSESSTPTENMMEEASQNVNGESNRDEKVKGILKAPKVGSKHSYGFKERLDLNFNHVMYGSKLKRNAVEMYQDNRLCEEFGLEPNIGNVYESRRPPSPVTNEATAPTRNLTKVPVNDDCNKQVTLDSREGSVTERSKPKEKQVAISKRQSQSRSKTTPSAEGAVESKVKKKQTEKRELEKSQPRPEMKVKVPSRDGAGGQQLQDQMAGMLGSLQNTGVQIQLSRDAWLNTITEHMNVDDQQKEGIREQMVPVLNMLFGEGETVNPLEFLNLTKDKFMERIFKMFSTDENLSEEDQQVVAGLANSFFDENGKIDLLKCVQAGQGLWTGQFKSMMDQALGQAESQNDDEADDDEAEDDESDKSRDTSFGHSAAALTYKTEENETDENDSEVERIDIDPDVWVQYANDEVVKGKVAQDVRESGMDTVICLDLSHSMRGYAWEQATTFIKNFVEGIQNSTLMDTSYEHIALVTYGSETRVQQHLTCDYVEIFRKLYRLKPSGPSPMYAGLQMVHAAILGAGMVFKCNGYRMYPRVFLITDGRATPAGMVSGPDVCPPELLQQEQFPILKVVKELHDKYHVTINTVPVGECDATLLEKIVQISKGKMISPEDWRMQSRVFKNYLAAAKLCGGPFAKMLAPGLKTMMLDAVNASPEDKIQMEEFLHRHEQEEDEDSDDQETDTFPPLGSRVRGHNPGSTIMTESMAIGTITKHFSDGHIGITWDEPNDNGKLREKKPYQPGARNVNCC
ncbi:uncharacterized protein LOC132746915 isoform X2 [Ruditapes philippinarum]|uniref:uncharacterized protein LOC132746915 isoform X2 n=1 Tax=Ruditapes philippinarum TaxID=129788 RepID=UPI00295AAC9B|nr:uncharacterized protein LOC132746915 isoform X2 [Ruditapes philippinarum]